MHEPDTVLATALYYTRLGYPVVPCLPGGKRPLLKHGLRAATTDHTLIAQWWRRWPEANLALLPPADVLVLDFDDAAVADGWAARYPELRWGPLARTPRRGAHCWLRLEARPEQLRTRANAADGAVDLRGLGRAYLVVPPSRTTDKLYVWERPLVQVHDLPRVSAALLDAVIPAPRARALVERTPSKTVTGRARRYALAALRSEHAGVASTPAGARNDRLNRAAYALGGYVAHGLLSTEEVEAALTAAAQACGLPEIEALRTIHSGLRAGREAPRLLPAPILNSSS